MRDSKAAIERKRRGPTWPLKLALIGGGLLAVVVLLELLLQLGGSVVERNVRRSASRLGATGTRIMTLGDSNTFGLYLDEQDSYPHQLETSWNTSVVAPKIVVQNLEYPGTNSVGLSSNYHRLLDSVQPQIILVQIGANDFWTPPIELSDSKEAGLCQLIERHSRIYKLLYILRRAYSEPPVLDVNYDRSLLRFGPVEPGGRPQPHWAEDASRKRTGVIRYGDEEFQIHNPDHVIATAALNSPDAAAAATRLARNLGQMVDDARGRGIEIALMTYPSNRFFYASANKITRRVAHDKDAPLIDIQAAFERICPDEECSEYLFGDHHANARGYGVVSDTIRDWLRGELGGD